MNKSRERDYLKYWRVIRYFVMRKYKLNTQELDMLLFLYSEEYFNVDKFKEFNKLLGWNKNRFNKLRKEGYMSQHGQDQFIDQFLKRKEEGFL